MSDNFYTNVQVYGKNILYRGIKNGKRVAQRIEYKPLLYVLTDKESGYKTLDGKYVQPVQAGDMKECRDFIEQYKDVHSFPIYGNAKFKYAFISDMFTDDIDFDPRKILIANIDIECGSENGFPDVISATEEVTAISVKIGNTIYSFGVGDFTTDDPNVQYHKCKNERDLLTRFIDVFTLNCPDIITGWNVKLFDIPYLVNRISNIMGEDHAKKLSPWKKISLKRTTDSYSNDVIYYDISGIATIDYLELYKKYGFSPQENYQLDTVAFYELGERKLDYSEYETLHQLYKSDHQKFIEYNIRDILLVEKLDNKKKLLDLVLNVAYYNKVNFEDVFYQVRMWDTITYNALKKINVVVPQPLVHDKDKEYGGAYVKEPIAGMYKYVVSFDLDGLYPHLMMQYNISPETLVSPTSYSDDMSDIVSAASVDSLLDQQINLSILKEYAITLTPNRKFFKIDDQGFLPKIMESMYKDRAKYKSLEIESKKKLESLDTDDPEVIEKIKNDISKYKGMNMALKVTLNSAYGSMGNQYFRFFDIRIAEAITSAGKLSIKWIERSINSYLNKVMDTADVDYIIAMDTDSVYINLEPLVIKSYGDTKDVPKIQIIDFMNNVCEKKIQPMIKKSYQNLANYMNAYAQKMNMKRETLADKAIWTAKKRYIMNAYDIEGVRYETPELKIMGIEAVKSSTPYICRTKIKEAIRTIMTGDEDALLDFIEDFREEFKQQKIEDISFPRSVNGIAQYHDASSVYKKGAPIQVKSALIYNKFIVMGKLGKKYQTSRDGNKIKFCYLKTPNPFHNNAIAFLNTIPPEFDIYEWIDYNTQFEKSFLAPLATILDCIGWKSERVSTISGFFV